MGTKLTKAGPLRRLWWLFAGKPDSVLLEEAAASCGLPVIVERFWPPFTKEFHGKSVWKVNRYLCPELYDARIGDVCPICMDDDFVYHYRVTGFSWASGSDHIVSPKEFWLQFAGRQALREASHDH